MKQIKATLISKKLIGKDVYHFFFLYDDPAFSFTPGQYAILTVPASPTPFKRLYSFASSSTQNGSFELLIKIIPGGLASGYLLGLKLGDVIDVDGPAGLFNLQENNKRKIYMVTGTGFAPIRSFLFSKTPSLNSVLFWGLKDFAEAYLTDELIRLTETHPSFSFYNCFSQQTPLNSLPARLVAHFKMGHVDSVWQSIIPAVSPEDEYYLCGSRLVVESLRTLLLSRGVEKNNLYFEKY